MKVDHLRFYPAKLLCTALCGLLIGATVQAEEKPGDEHIGIKQHQVTEKDSIPVPFTTLNKHTLTGSAIVITGEQLERYPSTDLRNALTGLVPGLNIQEYNGSPGLSPEEEQRRYRITEKVGVSARGTSMTYIIDGVPVNITEMTLDPKEVESVTIIKDVVEKNMFGPVGAGGVIYIKTKRGQAGGHHLNAYVESGVAVMDRMPEYVSGAEYARLNNQARINDGLTPNYSDSDIAAYEKSGPYDLYHPNVNFREMMLKNTMSYNRANVSSYGGNEGVKYYAYLGYSGEGDIYKIGSKADYNRINARSNIDMKINDFLDVQFDISAGLSYRRSPNYRYVTSEGSSYTNLVELNLALPEINSIPPIAFPVYANNDPSLESPWYGVSSLYSSNPIGNVTSNGHYTETGRKAAVKVALNYDMSHLIEGLGSQTFVSYDALNLIRLGTAEEYIAYIATPGKTAGGQDTIRLTKAHDGVDAPQLRNLHDYYYQRFALYEKLDYAKTFGVHDIQTSATFLMYRVAKDGIQEPQRFQTGVWSGRYTYNNKYTIQGVLNYTGTYSFNKDNRSTLFPSLGANWVLSEEDFLAGSNFVDFLKLRAQAGIIGYESFYAPFQYRDRWTGSTGASFGPYATGKWFGQNNDTSPYITYPSRIGNADLTWEKRKEFNIGIDGLFFDESLSLQVNYYNTLRDGQITRLYNSTPYITGITSTLPVINYSQTRYYGVEAALQYTHTNASGFSYSFGGNITLPQSKIVKYDDPNYRSAYQYRTGMPADSYWGQTYLGKFQSDEEATLVPQLYDDVLKAGDLKYKDMNEDGVIDDNDYSAIGHTTPRLFYSLNARFAYKNFEMYIMGTGSAFYDIPLTNEFYRNGWGDNNYSTFVRDNIGGAYPRLTYYKVNNNFVASDFWLIKGGYFKVQNVELAYTLPEMASQKIGSEKVRFFVRGANLLTISKVKDIDPESIDAGVGAYPLFRTFTGGVNFTF